ncbi:MAG: hypothetical protein AB7O31_02660 [Burkholderiales bacterium]
MRTMRVIALAALLGGCASFDGREFVASKATAAEVEAKLGKPAERIQRADGEQVLYFLGGRETLAVVLGKDGRVREASPRLSKANLAKLVPGTSTAKEVRELFGPPGNIVRMDRQQRDVWEYLFQHYEEMRVMWIQFSYDGVVQETLDMLDWAAYPPSGDSGAMP